MYRLGEVEHSHRRFYAILAGFVVLLVVGTLIALYFLKPNDQVGKAPPVVTTHIAYDSTKITTFTEPLFTIGLPSDWKPIVRTDDIPRPAFSWQGTTKDSMNRWLSVYIDQDVSNLPVNRELYVQASYSSLNALSDVSDNCTTFTGSAVQSHGTTPAKWQGINFLCDSGNYERDVVGIASPDGFNTVVVTSNGGSHHFFFTYTDNSSSPDYTTFINAIKSFHLK